MAKTLTRQARLFPFSGATGFVDGAGMSTRIAYELPYYLNNLEAYVTQRVIFAAGMSTSGQKATGGAGFVEIATNAASRELYVCQFPFVIKPGATRLVWTAGVEAFSVDGIATTAVTACTLYISTNFYNGAGPTTAFDTTNLPASTTSSRSVTLTISTTSTTGQYQLADDSATGFTPPPRALQHPAGPPDTIAYAIFTLTAQGGAQGFARIYDITLWPLFE